MFKKIQIVSLFGLLLATNSLISMDTCSKFLAPFFDKPAAALFAVSTGSVLAYGMAHRLFTNHLKYNTSKIKDSLNHGFKSTWKPALLLSIPLVAAARCGSWSQLNSSDLIKPLACTFTLVSLISLIKGLKDYNNPDIEDYSKKHIAVDNARACLKNAYLGSGTLLITYELYARHTSS